MRRKVRIHCNGGRDCNQFEPWPRWRWSFAVFTHEPFVYQRIGDEARRMRKLGMTLQAIGKALGVDEKTVRKVVRLF